MRAFPACLTHVWGLWQTEGGHGHMGVCGGGGGGRVCENGEVLIGEQFIIGDVFNIEQHELTPPLRLLQSYILHSKHSVSL